MLRAKLPELLFFVLWFIEAINILSRTSEVLFLSLIRIETQATMMCVVNFQPTFRGDMLYPNRTILNNHIPIIRLHLAFEVMAYFN